MTLLISREIVRGWRYLLMAISAASSLWTDAFVAGVHMLETGRSQFRSTALGKCLENRRHDRGQHTEQQESRQEADHQR